MNEVSFSKIRLYFTAIVSIAIWSLLTWNYFHGGIPRHHILADETLPEISNLWGALLLPVLTFFLLYRTQKRIFNVHDGDVAKAAVRNSMLAFAISLAYGIVLSVFFSLGYSDMTGNMMLGIFALALFFPVYRAECLLGLVIGMTFTFGAVLPTGIGTILVCITAMLFLGVRPAVLYVASKLRGKNPS